MTLENMKLSDLNDRIYSEESLNNLVECSKNRLLYGELGNPTTFDVSLSNVSHTIENLKITDRGIYGDIRILDTQSGRIVQQCINSDIYFKARERSLIIKEKNNTYIQSIFTYDLEPLNEFENLMKRRRLKIEKIMEKLNDDKI